MPTRHIDAYFSLITKELRNVSNDVSPRVGVGILSRKLASAYRILQQLVSTQEFLQIHLHLTLGETRFLTSVTYHDTSKSHFLSRPISHNGNSSQRANCMMV